MRELLFNPGGGYASAAYFGVIPLVLLLLALLRRIEGVTRFRSLPLLALLLIYYGILYWWLFYDQFYRLEVQPGNVWKLEYRLPTRDKIIATRDIADLVLESGDIRTHQMTRLVIVTADGEHYPSAQISERQAKEYRAILAQFGQEQRERQ